MSKFVFRPQLVTGPTETPVSLDQLKRHLRLDVAEQSLTIEPSIPAGSHDVASSFSLVGSAVNITNYSATVVLNAGDCSAGTVTVKIQDSITGSSGWTDVATFTAVTAANDNQAFQYSYTGIKPYLRAVATVATDACEFGVDVLLNALTSVEDTELSMYLATAQALAEDKVARKSLTQTWKVFLDCFPCVYSLPFRHVQEISSVQYYDTDNVLQTLASDQYQLLDGHFVKAPDVTFPSTSWRADAVQIEFVCGWETTDDVPIEWQHLLLLWAGHFHKNREATTEINLMPVPMAVESLLEKFRWDYRLD